MSGGASAKALYARLETNVSKAVTHVDLALLSGLPTNSNSLPEDYDFRPFLAVFDSIAEIKRTIAAPDRIPNAIGKRLLPFAAAYNKFSGLFCSLSSSDPPSATVAAFAASQLISLYAQVIFAALHEISSGDVSVATLIKLLEPFSLIELAMVVVQQAFDYIQECPYPTGSKQLLHKIGVFQGSLHNIFIIVSKLAHISILIIKSPAFKSKIAKLEAEGTSYVNKDALWELMDKIVHLLANHKAHGVHGLKEADPYVNAATVVGNLISLEKIDDDSNSETGTSTVLSIKRCLHVFYSKDYDVCYFKAFKYFAEDAGSGKSIPEEDYDLVLVNLTKFAFLLHDSNGDEEQSVPGYKEALAISGSEEVQQRIYSACLKIFNRAIEENGKMEPRAARLYALASNVLAGWGVKRLISTKEGKRHTHDDVAHDLIAKSDILMAKSWTKVMHIMDISGEDDFSYDLLAAFVPIYILMRGKWYPFEKILRDGAHLNPDENGEYSKLKLHFDELEAMYSTTMMLCLTARNASIMNSMSIMTAMLDTILRFSRSLANSGIYDLPKGDERYLVIWELYKEIALTAMKTAKAYLLEPKTTWARLGISTKEMEDFIGVIVGRCNLELFFVPSLLLHFGDEASTESYFKYCAALALLGLDSLKYTPEAIWKKDVGYMQGYGNLVFMVNIFQETLLNALPSSEDEGLSTLHKIVTELANNSSDGAFQVSMGERIEGAGPDLALYEAKSRHMLQQISRIVQGLEKRTNGASDAAKKEREISCAVVRAKILRVLPCSSLSCTTMCPFGKKNVPSNVCSGCRVARYCSAKCQKENWKFHKVDCKALAAGGRS